MNILYVEDYALTAALVRDTLQRRSPDIRLDIVSTVGEAIARLERFESRFATSPAQPRPTDDGNANGEPIPYDAVLTDLKLPDGLGLEILSHVRARQLMLAVVILTGSADEDTVIGALHAGADDYVIKRDDYLAGLPRTLSAAIARFRSQRARTSRRLRVLYADADSGGFEAVRVELNRIAPHIALEPIRSADALLSRLDGADTATDVLLLDDRLPGWPLIGLIKRVAELAGAKLPIVLTMAPGNERLAPLAIRLGVADYLNKSDSYPQRLAFALEGAHLKAVGVRERAALLESEERFRAFFEREVAARTRELADANQALILARDAADSADQAKRRFLANMSREIRAPIGSIIGLAHLLRTEVTRQQPLDRLSKLTREASHLLRIIDDMLDVSKIEAGQTALELTTFSLRRVLEDALEIVEERAQAKSLVLELTVDPQIPDAVFGDPLRLSRIVLNFLVHAIEFTGQGTVRLGAGLVEAVGDAIRLRLEVQDAGIGLEPEQLERLFEPFPQADELTSRRHRDTGLGLVIAHRLAGLMDGQVGASSRPGIGSTIWATVRLGKVASQPRQRAAGGPLPTAATLRPFAGARVLLADDDPVSLLVTSHVLKQCGFAVDIVHDGVEVVDRVRRHRYDLLVIDLHMPLMDGLAAARQVRALPSGNGLPIIAMAASEFEEERQRCRDTGIDEHLCKPFDPARLLAAVARCLPRGRTGEARSVGMSDPRVDVHASD